jgi:hypothetical protein
MSNGRIDREGGGRGCTTSPPCGDQRGRGGGAAINGTGEGVVGRIGEGGSDGQTRMERERWGNDVGNVDAERRVASFVCRLEANSTFSHVYVQPAGTANNIACHRKFACEPISNMLLEIVLG